MYNRIRNIKKLHLFQEYKVNLKVMRCHKNVHIYIYLFNIHIITKYEITIVIISKIDNFGGKLYKFFIWSLSCKCLNLSKNYLKAGWKQHAEYMYAS